MTLSSASDPPATISTHTNEQDNITHSWSDQALGPTLSPVHFPHNLSLCFLTSTSITTMPCGLTVCFRSIVLPKFSLLPFMKVNLVSFTTMWRQSSAPAFTARLHLCRSQSAIRCVYPSFVHLPHVISWMHMLFWWLEVVLACWWSACLYRSLLKPVLLK